MKVRFTYDINGILLVDAVILSNNEEHHLILGANDDSDYTKKQIEKLKELRTVSWEAEENKFLQVYAERVHQQFSDVYAREILSSQRLVFAAAMRTQQDLYAIQREGKALTALLKTLEREYLSEYEIYEIHDKYI